MTLEELFNIASEVAEAQFAANGEVMPQWIAGLETGDIAVFMTPWNSEEEKDEIVARMPAIFDQKGVVRFVLMVEAWSLEVPAGADRRDYAGPPSEHEERREVVIFNAEDRDGRAIFGRRYILRPEHGKPALSPMKLLPADVTMEGRLAHLLRKAA